MKDISVLTELDSDHSGHRLKVDFLATALIIHRLQHHSTQKYHTQLMNLHGSSRWQLQPVIDYIHAHLDQNLTLAELAALVPISPSHFSHSFKQLIGVAPYQYVIQCRIDWAKQLLLQGMSIANVAQDIGFANQSHFSRHFKRWVGTSPKAFVQSQ